MSETSIHRVTSVKALVGEPQEDIMGERYCVTKIEITTEEGYDHRITLFGARAKLDLDLDGNPQTAVYPFVEMERPNVDEG